MARQKRQFRLDIKAGNALKGCATSGLSPAPGLAMDTANLQRRPQPLHDERRYRVFADLERIAGRFPHAVWHSPNGPRNVVDLVLQRLSRHGAASESGSAPWSRPPRGSAPAPAAPATSPHPSSAGSSSRNWADLHGKQAAAVVSPPGYVEPNWHCDHRQADSQLP